MLDDWSDLMDPRFARKKPHVPTAAKDSTNVIDFAEAKANEARKPFDLDAKLARLGLDRAVVDAAFTHHVTNERKEAPDVVFWRKQLTEHRKTMRELQVVASQTSSPEIAAEAQTEFAGMIECERFFEDRIMIAKCQYLHRLGSSKASAKCRG